MSHEKLYEEATKVAAKAGGANSDGPDSVVAKASPELADQTDDDWFHGLIKARAQHFAKDDAELSFGFYGLALVISGYINSGSLFNAEILADECERLAKAAGEELASLNGEPPHPNTHLEFLADLMRKVRKPAVTAIDGDNVAADRRMSAMLDSTPTVTNETLDFDGS